MSLKMKVAVVEDDPRMFAVTRSKLKATFRVEQIEITSSVEELTQEILHGDYDAVLIDFRLKGTSVAQYEGDAVIDEIRKHSKTFPLVLLTGYMEDSLNVGINPDTVYKREDLTKNQEEFINKLTHKIMNYRIHKKKIELEYDSLLKASRKHDLTAKQRERIIELDTELENDIDVSARLPQEIKDNESIRKLSELIESTQELIKRLDKDEI